MKMLRRSNYYVSLGLKILSKINNFLFNYIEYIFYTDQADMGDITGETFCCSFKRIFF